MSWIVEQQAKSGLGQLVWLKVAGPFERWAEADAVALRLEKRHRLQTPVMKQAQP